MTTLVVCIITGCIAVIAGVILVIIPVIINSAIIEVLFSMLRDTARA
jgi:hypothetical protein